MFAIVSVARLNIPNLATPKATNCQIGNFPRCTLTAFEPQKGKGKLAMGRQALREAANFVSRKLPADRLEARRKLDVALELKRWQLGLGELSLELAEPADRADAQKLAPYLMDNMKDAESICDLAMELIDWGLGRRAKLSSVG